VTEVACIQRDFDVFSDDDLRMTGDAAQLPAALALKKMGLMVKFDPPAERQFTLQKTLGVASLPQAGGIIDLCKRPRRIGSRYVFDDLGQCLEFLP
jgi:hypothetical protein